MFISNQSSLIERAGRILLYGATGFVALLALLALLRIGLYAWLYSSVEDWVTVRLGFDYYAAQLAATLMVTVVSFVLPTLAWYLVLGRKQYWGAGLIVGGQALVFLLMYSVGAQVCFDRRTGAPQCYYADTTQGRVWSRTPGFDPQSGQAFKLYTREVKECEDAERNRRQQEADGHRNAEAQRLEAERQASHAASLKREAAERARATRARIAGEHESRARERRLERERLAEQRREEAAESAHRFAEAQRFAATEEARLKGDAERRARESERQARAEQERQERARVERERELLAAQERQAVENVRHESEHRRAEEDRRQQEREDAARQRAAKEHRREARQRAIIETINRSINVLSRRY